MGMIGSLKMQEALLEPDEDTWRRVGGEIPSFEIAAPKSPEDRQEPLSPLSQMLTSRAEGNDETGGFNWTDMVHITGPRDAAERLKSYWTSIGVTAALLCSMAFSGLFTGPIEHGVNGPL